MDNECAARGVCEVAGRCMGSIIKSIGHGLLAAGVFLIVMHGFGAYLRGREAFRDALHPTAVKTYLTLLKLVSSRGPRGGRQSIQTKRSVYLLDPTTPGLRCGIGRTQGSATARCLRQSLRLIRRRLVSSAAIRSRVGCNGTRCRNLDQCCGHATARRIKRLVALALTADGARLIAQER